jgi:hypothetical protein
MPDDLTRILSVTAATLVYWRRVNIGPPWIKAGRRYYYPAGPFRDYLEALTGGTPVPTGLDTEAKRVLFARVHRPIVPVDEARYRLGWRLPQEVRAER